MFITVTSKLNSIYMIKTYNTELPITLKNINKKRSETYVIEFTKNNQTASITVPNKIYDSLQIGDTVSLQIKKGILGIEFIEKLK